MTTLQDGYDALLVDLDGVVYVGPDAVPGAISALTEARQNGLAVGYVTNNANRPAPDVAVHLRELGLELLDSDVVTSAQIAAGLVRERYGAAAAVLAVGGPGVRIALEAEGLHVLDSAEDRPVAVVQGYGPDVGWRQLAEASYAIQAGAHFVATNTDLTIPQARGIAPGNGTMVLAVRAATGVEPEVAGKPQAIAFQAAATRLGSQRPLVIGDRLDTDIEGANAAAFDSLMVLTGVHGFRELSVAPPEQRPTYLAAHLGSLRGPAAAVLVPAAAHHATSGDTTVETVDGEVVRRSGTDPVEAIRATLPLLWSALDDGRALRLSDELSAAVHDGTVGGAR